MRKTYHPQEPEPQSLALTYTVTCPRCLTSSEEQAPPFERLCDQCLREWRENHLLVDPKVDRQGAGWLGPKY